MENSRQCVVRDGLKRVAQKKLKSTVRASEVAQRKKSVVSIQSVLVPLNSRSYALPKPSDSAKEEEVCVLVSAEMHTMSVHIALRRIEGVLIERRMQQKKKGISFLDLKD